MPRIVSAIVTRADGRSFEAKLANLTPHSLFLITRESLNFRERVSVVLLGVAVEGEVAFAIAEPRLGAVIVFQTTRAVREVLSRHLDEIEVFAVALGHDVAPKKNGTVEEEWLEPTTAAGPHNTPAKDASKEPPPKDPTRDSQVNLRWTARTSMTPLAEPQIPALGAEGLDLETVDEMPIDPDTLVPFDAETEQAQKQPPDYGESPTPQNMPVIGAPDLYKRPPLLVKGAVAKKTKAPSVVAPEPPPLVAPVAPQPQPPPARSISRPKLPKREDPTIPDVPHDDLARIQASIKPEPVKLPPQLQSPSASAELPILESDACTVMFSNHAHFRAHYETTMMHGGIIVRSDPMLVGQQRALVLRIVNTDEHYSLVGRVAFNGKDGSVGFMIESFLQHRPLLEALANQTQAAAR